jgi:hypothetical protein
MDVRGEIYDPEHFSTPGRFQKPETFKVIPDVEVKRLTSGDDRVRKSNQIFKLLESLILAQDERWRRA